MLSVNKVKRLTQDPKNQVEDQGHQSYLKTRVFPHVVATCCDITVTTQSHLLYPAASASGWWTRPLLSDQGRLGPSSSLLLPCFIAQTVLQTMPVALLLLCGLSSVLAF